MEIKDLTIIEVIERANKKPKIGRQLQSLLSGLAHYELEKEEKELYSYD